MKKNILYATADASPQSGAFLQLIYMSQGIKKQGYWPVLALHKEVEGSSLFYSEKLNSTYFFNLPRPKRRQQLKYYINFIIQNFCSIRNLVRLIRKEQIDLVHINEIYDIYAGIASIIARVPSVWHVRADPPPWLRCFLSIIILSLATKVVVVSNSVRERIFGKLGKDKVIVLHDPGPDLSRFHPEVDGAYVRKEFGINNEDYVVTLVAKITERKGHEVFIKAMPKIIASFPKLRFMIVGGSLEGSHHSEYKNRLKNLIQKLGVDSKVIFTGYRKDIPQIMAASDIILHCSTYPDPFPGVVLQGMAVGKPVIASNLGGVKEQIKNGISGILVEPSNPEVLAETICNLLADRDKRYKLGKLAAEQAFSRFSSAVFFQRLSNIYDELTRR